MGLFQDAVKGFVNGFVESAADNRRSSDSSEAAIARFIAQLGWSVDDKFGDKGIILHFNDPIIKVRKVLVVPDYLTLFRTYSAAVVAGNALPKEVLGYLLTRNRALSMGAWQLQELDNGNAAFALEYCMVTDGLNAALFKAICGEQVKEAHAFDGKMKAAGLL